MFLLFLSFLSNFITICSKNHKGQIPNVGVFLFDFITTCCMNYNKQLPIMGEKWRAEIRNNREQRKRRYEGKTCIHFIVSDTISTKIKTFETAKQGWDLLKEEYHGNIRKMQMQILDLRWEFEM